MKAGVVYPQIEPGGDTGAVKAFAQAAEDGPATLLGGEKREEVTSRS